MFSHLKPEEFVHLVEGGTVPADRLKHIETCGRCLETWKSLQSMHSSMTMADEDIPEPEWSEFRTTVRDEMLSRSVRREAAHGWSVFSFRPGLAWAFSVLFAVGITAGAFMLRERPAAAPPAAPVEELAPAAALDLNVGPLIEVQDVETEMKMWTKGSVFEDISQLESGEAESLRTLLEMEGPGALQTQ